MSKNNHHLISVGLELKMYLDGLFLQFQFFENHTTLLGEIHIHLKIAQIKQKNKNRKNCEILSWDY